MLSIRATYSVGRDEESEFRSVEPSTALIPSGLGSPHGLGQLALDEIYNDPKMSIVWSLATHHPEPADLLTTLPFD